MNVSAVVRVNAGVVLALGMSLLVRFLVPALIMAFIGGVGILTTQASSSRSVEYVSNRDVYLSVTLAWMLAARRSSVPGRRNLDSFLGSRGGCLRGSAKVSTATGETSYCKWGELY